VYVGRGIGVTATGGGGGGGGVRTIGVDLGDERVNVVDLVSESFFFLSSARAGPAKKTASASGSAVQRIM